MSQPVVDRSVPRFVTIPCFGGLVLTFGINSTRGRGHEPGGYGIK
jgi:hypothetical protein